MFVLEFLAALLSHVKRQRKTKVVENRMEEENRKSSILTCGVNIASLAHKWIRRLDVKETPGLDKSVKVICIEVVFNIK